MDQPPGGPPPSAGGGGPDWNQMKGKLTAAKGPDRLVLIAGGLFFIDSFLPWYGASFLGVTINVSGWSSQGWAVLAILLGIAATVVAALAVVGVDAIPAQTQPTLLLGLSGGAFVFTVIRLVTQTSGAKFGLYLGIVFTAAMAYGAYQKFGAAKK